MKKKKFRPGPLFGESIEKNKSAAKLPKKDTLKRANEWVEKGFFESDSKSYQQSISKWRLAAFYVIFILVFATLFARSFELQVIEGDIFLGKAEENHYRVKVAHAPRGVIYDRNGVVLARNNPSFSVSIDPLSIPEDRDVLLEKISKIFNLCYYGELK